MSLATNLLEALRLKNEETETLVETLYRKVLEKDIRTLATLARATYSCELCNSWRVPPIVVEGVLNKLVQNGYVLEDIFNHKNYTLKEVYLEYWGYYKLHPDNSSGGKAISPEMCKLDEDFSISLIPQYIELVLESFREQA